ncbi:hypothetical protein R84B8_01743 [Treponema sp. R8-4-B8]
MRNEKLVMKKNTTGLSAVFFRMIMVLFTFVIFFACHDPFNSLSPQTPDGTGQVTLVIGGVNGRTILPGSDLDQFKAFTFYFYEPGTIDTDPAVGLALVVSSDNTGSSYTITVPAGEYDLLVNAWEDADKTKLAAQGRLEGDGTVGGITIADGDIKAYTVTLITLITENKKGTFKWKITFPAGLSSASMTIVPADPLTGTAPAPVEFDLTEALAFTGSADLNSGYYTVVFELERENAQKLTYSEILHVYQYLESSFEFEFKDEHFSKMKYAVTFDYNDGKTQPLTGVGFFDQTINDPGAPNYLKPIPAGLYQPTPPANCTFIDWYFMGKKWDFGNDKVAGDMTLTAHWIADKLVDVSDKEGANDIIKAINHVIETPEDYTLLIGAYDSTKTSVNIGSWTLPANCHLTIKSIGTGERMIMGASANSPLFTINGASLTLGNNITLFGISNGTTSLVSVTAGALIMENGSKITGHTTSSPNGVVYVDGTFTANGGNVSGNTVSSGQGDVFITEEGSLTLSGGAQIGVVTLKATDTKNAVIGIGPALTGGVNSINLYADVASITDVPQKWLNKHVLQAVAGSGYALTTADVGKFKTGNFITSGATQAINAPDSVNSAPVGYLIEDSGTDIGKLVVNNVPVAMIGLTEFLTLNAAIEAASAGNASNPTEITIMRNITVPEPGMTANTGYIINNKHITLAVESAVTITASAGAYRMFTVNSGASLNLDGTGGSLTLNGNGSAASNRQGVFVNGGTFAMNNNVTITGFRNNSGNGGGVYLAGGTFTMSGGTIYGSSAGTGLANTASSGASLYKAGGTANYGGAYGTDAINTTNDTLPSLALDSVTADGSTTQSTTQLTLTFDKPISGLTADNITLSGVSGVIKGTLSGSNPYTLQISGFTSSGTLNVAVARPGFVISGSQKTADIFYYSAVTDVTLSQTALTLTVDDTAILTPAITPDNATNKNVTWSTSNGGVATINNGTVTAVAAGTATITVTTEDGNKTAECAVTVKPADGK